MVLKGNLKIGDFLIANVKKDDHDNIYKTLRGRGRPSKKHPINVVKIKTLQKLLMINYLLCQSHINLEKTDPEIVCDFVQKYLKVNRQTARDYTKTLHTLQCNRPSHFPNIIDESEL